MVGTEHLDYARSVFTLALIQIDEGDAAGARVNLLHARKAFVETWGPENTHVSAVDRALAKLDGETH